MKNQVSDPGAVGYISLIPSVPGIGGGGGGGESAAVVNDQVLAVTIGLPAKSFTPVVIVTVYEIEAASKDVGSNMAVFPSALNVTVSGILVVPA